MISFTNLFTESDADFRPMVSYLQTFLSEDSPEFNLFQLPPIQRNAVWNVAQIERLWDSVLRGYPIGSFLVSPRRANDNARDVDNGIQAKSDKDGYFLLDGQQRTRALLLGFRPTQDARLWIDLNPSLNFNNAEFNDRRFLLRVLTNYQPWGMDDRNPADKVHRDSKYEARDDLREELLQTNANEAISLRYDYEISIHTGTVTNDTAAISWPVKATLPVPLDELILLCGGLTGYFKHPSWKDVCKLIPSRYIERIPSIPSDHYNTIIDGIRNILDVTSSDVRTRMVVLLYQNLIHNEVAENEQDDMEVLFRRVNAGGTVLQGEEMSYSLLKASWDGAYDMVSAIMNSDSVGYLLSPTSIVMAATRLARFVQGETDTANPGIGNFRRWIGERKDDNAFLKTMQSLLLLRDGQKAVMQEVMEKFCDLVLYNAGKDDDIGIPRKLLISIHPVLFHPVFVWIYLNIDDKDKIERNRVSIIRYLLHCKITVNKYDDASKCAIKTIRNDINNQFPDRDIYKALLKEGITASIPSPVELGRPCTIRRPDGLLRTWNELFDNPDDHYNAFRHSFWRGSNELLLWFQRSYAVRWFKGYNPTSNDAYDTPYDWDHILPSSHLKGQGLQIQHSLNNQEHQSKFLDSRNWYIDSVGNRRLWPLWCNRSDGNRCHTIKLRLKEYYTVDSVAEELNLFSDKDFLNASMINENDINLWFDAEGEPGIWPEKRRIAWQTAVENRVSYLYEIYFNTFGFSIWKESEEVKPSVTALSDISN